MEEETVVLDPRMLIGHMGRLEDIGWLLRSGERYREYVLSARLRVLGQELLGIRITNDYRSYRTLGDVPFLLALIRVRMGDGRTGEYRILARSAGEESEWVELLEMDVDDLVLRFSIDRSGYLYSPIFVSCCLSGDWIELHGSVLCWDRWDREESVEEEEDEWIPGNDPYDRDELLCEAFDDNIDDWLCR